MSRPARNLVLSSSLSLRSGGLHLLFSAKVCRYQRQWICHLLGFQPILANLLLMFSGVISGFGTNRHLSLIRKLYIIHLVILLLRLLCHVKMINILESNIRQTPPVYIVPIRNETSENVKVNQALSKRQPTPQSSSELKLIRFMLMLLLRYCSGCHSQAVDTAQ